MSKSPVMPKNTLFIGLLCLVLFVRGFTRPVMGSDDAGSDTAYDVVIRGGRVLDGAGNPWINADIAIKDGR
ncbi:MAG TPA: hypothetical protein VEZ90_02600, partial [Blastocatellia bacterium]|nr:hypothetical protein [Blastocatellia bacterium]